MSEPLMSVDDLKQKVYQDVYNEASGDPRFLKQPDTQNYLREFKSFVDSQPISQDLLNEILTGYNKDIQTKAPFQPIAETHPANSKLEQVEQDKQIREGRYEPTRFRSLSDEYGSSFIGTDPKLQMAGNIVQAVLKAFNTNQIAYDDVFDLVETIGQGLGLSIDDARRLGYHIQEVIKPDILETSETELYN